MIIKKIRLQNIKSYVDREISFHRGVNFISGVNGAGKSTIIEAIGYALFNYNPYGNSKELIRYGLKSGIITVDFMANDDRDYRIIRKIGTSTLWAVYDLETDSLLQQGVKDLQDWLKEVMGIAPDLDLSQLFKDIIGVSQGTFVAPFLETEAERKRKFDGILRVEQYREAFNDTSRAVAMLNKELGTKDTELKVMAEQVKDYQSLKEEKAELEKMLAQLKTKIAQMLADITEKTTELKKIEEIKNNLEKTRGELLSAENADKLLAEKAKITADYLQKAREAKSLVTTAEPGYKAYIVLEEELKKLERQKSEQEQLEKELNNVNQKIIGLKAQVAEQKKGLTQQQEEIKINRGSIQTTMQSLEKEMAKTRQNLDLILSSKAQLNSWHKDEDKVSEIKSELEAGRREIISAAEKSDALKEEIKNLEKQLASFTETQSIANQYAEREKLLAETRADYRALKERQKITLENSAQLREGLCPFLNDKCPNINQQTDFANQLESINKELNELEKKGSTLKSQFDEALEAREKLKVLLVHKKRLEDLTEQLRTINGNQNTTFGQIAQLPLVKALLDLQNTSKQSLARLSELKSAFNDLNNDGTYNEKLTKMEDVLATCEEILEESKNTREAMEKSYSEKELDTSGELSRKTADYNNARQTLSQLAEKDNKLKESESDIIQKLKLTEDLEAQASAFRDKLNLYTDISKEIANNKEKQNKYRQYYETYRQNELEAKKVPTLESNLVKVQNEIVQNKERIDQYNKFREKLNQQFDQDKYLLAKEELDHLKQETAREKQFQLERENDLADNKKRLAEIEKILARMSKIKDEIEFKAKKLRLLDITRTILNKAGPSVARIYLENLSREANELYRQVSHESVSLEWQRGYEIVLIDNYNGQSRVRSFKQFSGGEQMTAALAVRLALLKQQSGVRIGFFDEPTANLDSGRRTSLAETIPKVTGGFEQLFVISHDDTFDEITENVIQLQKDEINGTNLLS